MGGAWVAGRRGALAPGGKSPFRPVLQGSSHSVPLCSFSLILEPHLVARGRRPPSTQEMVLGQGVVLPQVPSPSASRPPGPARARFSPWHPRSRPCPSAVLYASARCRPCPGHTGTGFSLPQSSTVHAGRSWGCRLAPRYRKRLEFLLLTHPLPPRPRSSQLRVLTPERASTHCPRHSSGPRSSLSPLFPAPPPHAPSVSPSQLPQSPGPVVLPPTLPSACLPPRTQALHLHSTPFLFPRLRPGAGVCVVLGLFRGAAGECPSSRASVQEAAWNDVLCPPGGHGAGDPAVLLMCSRWDDQGTVGGQRLRGVSVAWGPGPGGCGLSWRVGR